MNYRILFILSFLVLSVGIVGLFFTSNNNSSSTTPITENTSEQTTETVAPVIPEKAIIVMSLKRSIESGHMLQPEDYELQTLNVKENDLQALSKDVTGLVNNISGRQSLDGFIVTKPLNVGAEVLAQDLVSPASPDFMRYVINPDQEVVYLQCINQNELYILETLQVGSVVNLYQYREDLFATTSPRFVLTQLTGDLTILRINDFRKGTEQDLQNPQRRDKDCLAIVAFNLPIIKLKQLYELDKNSHLVILPKAKQEVDEQNVQAIEQNDENTQNHADLVTITVAHLNNSIEQGQLLNARNYQLEQLQVARDSEEMQYNILPLLNSDSVARRNLDGFSIRQSFKAGERLLPKQLISPEDPDFIRFVVDAQKNAVFYYCLNNEDIYLLNTLSTGDSVIFFERDEKKMTQQVTAPSRVLKINDFRVANEREMISTERRDRNCLALLSVEVPLAQLERLSRLQPQNLTILPHQVGVNTEINQSVITVLHFLKRVSPGMILQSKDYQLTTIVVDKESADIMYDVSPLLTEGSQPRNNLDGFAVLQEFYAGDNAMITDLLSPEHPNFIGYIMDTKRNTVLSYCVTEPNQYLLNTVKAGDKVTFFTQYEKEYLDKSVGRKLQRITNPATVIQIKLNSGQITQQQENNKEVCVATIDTQVPTGQLRELYQLDKGGKLVLLPSKADDYNPVEKSVEQRIRTIKQLRGAANAN